VIPEAKGVYSLENNPNLQQVEEPRNEISKSVSEASKSPLKTAERSEEYNPQIKIKV
jgi:hypothetical protein